MAAGSLLARRRPAVLDATLYRGFESREVTVAWLRERRPTGTGIFDRISHLVLDTPDVGRVVIKPESYIVHVGRGKFEVLTQTEFDARYDLIGFDE